MDSSITSSIVSTLGSGSGVNMAQLATDLSVARYAARIQQLETKSELLETRISAAATLRSSLTDLASAIGDRVRTGDLAPQATIGNSSVASVSVTTGSSATGSYTLEVEQLASAQTLVGNTYTSADTEVGEGTLTLRFGTVASGAFTADTARDAVTIDVAAGATLSDVASAINASGSGVTAYVATGASGAQLVFKGADGGDNGFIVEASGASASGGTPAAGNIDYLAWDPSTDSGELRETAQDALFKFDTISMSSATNSISGLPAGLNLSLTGTNVGAPTRIEFSSNTSQISEFMSDFVAALNDITSQLSESADPLGGELGSDPGARRLKRELAALAGDVVMTNAAEGTARTLGDLGLSINRDGTFSLDSERLSTTLANQPEAASAMFTNGLYGVFGTMDSLARATATTSDPGTLAGSVARYTASSETITEQLAKIADQQEALRTQLTTQFSRTDISVASSQSTLSFLRDQIDAWNNSNN